MEYVEITIRFKRPMPGLTGASLRECSDYIAERLATRDYDAPWWLSQIEPEIIGNRIITVDNHRNDR